MNFGLAVLKWWFLLYNMVYKVRHEKHKSMLNNIFITVNHFFETTYISEFVLERNIFSSGIFRPTQYAAHSYIAYIHEVGRNYLPKKNRRKISWCGQELDLSCACYYTLFSRRHFIIKLCRSNIFFNVN